MIRQRDRRLFTGSVDIPSFELALKTSLVPEKALGSGTPTFTRSSSATCMGYAEADNSGAAQTLLTIPAGIPRFEGARFIASNNTWSGLFADGAAIPDATLHGYVAEGARTNLALQSEDFNNASWTGLGLKAFGSGSVANATTAPNVTVTADLIVEDTGNNPHRIYQSVGTLAAATYTKTLFLKPAGRTKIALYQTNVTAYGVLFDLTAVTATTITGGATGTITAAANGFYKCTMTYTTVASFEHVFSPYLYTTSISYTGDGTSGIYLWGAQLEAGAFASSYIHTTTAAVTRAADVLTYPTAGNVDGTKGAAYMEVSPEMDIPYSSTPGYGTNYILDLGYNAIAMRVFQNSIKMYDGSNFTSSPAWIPIKGTRYKTGSKWGGSSMAAAINGTLGTAGTFDGDMNPTENLSIGNYGGSGGYEWNGTIRNVKIWKKALTDAKLVSLTS